MKALVTGATGFIGSHLVEALLSREIAVRCLVRGSSRHTWLDGLSVELAYGDCEDEDSLTEAVKGVDLVFHAAGITKAVSEQAYRRVNALGTEHLIRACIKHNPSIEKFVLFSSQAAAGPCHNGGRKKESDPCEPVSAYGRSKRMAEQIALRYSTEIPVVILRPSAVYGPRERDIYRYIRLLAKKIMPVFPDPDQRVSLCYVGDIVDAAIRASEKSVSSGEIFFISDGCDYRTEDIGKAFADAMGVSPVRIPIPAWLFRMVGWTSDCLARLTNRPALINRGKVEEIFQKEWLCDISKARAALSFEPRVPLALGARLTVEWYRKQNWL